MIFQKPSLRTRVSFEVAMYELGGYAIYLAEDIKFGIRESVPDIAKNLSRYVDVIIARVFDHKVLEELAKYADVPVINALSDLYHPCQIISDLFTIYEKKGKLKGLTLSFFGDGRNNVAHSLLLGCAKVGMNIKIAAPQEFYPYKEILDEAKNDAEKNKSSITITSDPNEAAKNVDIIYTDVWASMGEEKEAEYRKKIMMPYQVNDKIIKLAKKDCIVMHCLPAHREEEITSSVIDGKHSIVFDQAENRLHTQKAILYLILG
jgi:ornithine carbamoyltransferase